MRNFLYLILGLLIILSGYWWWDQNKGLDLITKEIAVYFVKSNPTAIVAQEVSRNILVHKDNLEEIVTRTVQELLDGPTSAEKQSGLLTAINSETELNYAQVNENGEIILDFNYHFDYQVGGSATVLAIREQLEKTVFQFDFAKDLVLTIDQGSREAVLEP